MIQNGRYFNGNFIELPSPIAVSETSIEETLWQRKSTRKYAGSALTLQEVGQILWSSYGVNTPKGGGRTVPSAGGVYPLSFYLVAKTVEIVEPGVYRYWPAENRLSEVITGTVSRELAAACSDQEFVEEAPACLVFAAELSRMMEKYGSRGELYVYYEVGHASENVYLQAQSLGLGTVAVGAFDEAAVGGLLNLPERERVLYLMPFGSPA